MKIADIELYDISKHRGELMGFAMVIIILFHMSVARYSPFFGLHRMGNVGVDIFLFLSGMGLWFSWIKTPQLKHFWINRYWRIYPAWIIVSLAYFGIIHHGDWLYIIKNVTINWDFWARGDLNFWYFPAILALYLVAPFYMKLIIKYPIYRWLVVLPMMWCIIVQWVTPIHVTLFHLEIFWSRIPIFFIGINMGAMVKGKRTLKIESLYLILLMFAVSFGVCVYLEQIKHDAYPVFIERMLYIPFAISLILILSKILNHVHGWIKVGFRFVGLVSLEVYLLHVEFVFKFLLRYQLGYWMISFAVIICTLPFAWLLNKAVYVIEKIVRKRSV